VVLGKTGPNAQQTRSTRRERSRSRTPPGVRPVQLRDDDGEVCSFDPKRQNADLTSGVFNLGIKRGYLVENPVNRLDFAELEKGEKRKVRPEGQPRRILWFHG
jgi:hypothetical protein